MQVSIHLRHLNAQGLLGAQGPETRLSVHGTRDYRESGTWPALIVLPIGSTTQIAV